MREGDTRKPVVLLVDDEPQVLEGLRNGLRKAPFELLWAASGQEALEILAARIVDVIVADEQMPGMRGSLLLAHVRERRPSVLRILLTGKASVSSALDAIYDGWVYRYLRKPFHPVELASVIHNGLLLQSLQTEEEGPHVFMTTEQQTDLLDDLSQKSGI